MNVHASVTLDLGDKSQFTEVYNLFYESLCFFAQRYVGDSNQAEDIIGELFAKLWQRAPSFEDEEHLRAYLYRSASNSCYTHVKALQSLKAREERYGIETSYTEQNLLFNIIRAELWREVYQAIESLPNQCSVVIKMSYVEGLKNNEIAEKLGLSMQTVKNYKHRGLSILRGTVSSESYTFLLIYMAFYLQL